MRTEVFYLEDKMVKTSIEEIKSAQDAEKLAREYEQKSKELFAQANEHWEKAKALVKTGETMGNKLRDFVFLRYGCLGKFDEVYRDIEHRVSEHVGQFILLFCAHDSSEGCCSPGGGGPNYVRRNGFCLGILKGGSLILHEPEKGCKFETENYVLKTDRKTEIISGNLGEVLPVEVFWTRQLNFGIDLAKPEAKDLPLGGHLFSFERRNKIPNEVALIIGDAEIKNWVGEKTRKELSWLFVNSFYEMCKLLGRVDEEFFNKFLFSRYRK